MANTDTDSEPGKPSDEKAATGAAYGKLERRAATVLAAELESTGRVVQTHDVKVPRGPALTLVVHAALALAASLIGIETPVAGAVIALIVAFSFYSERALGLPLLGRALPRRTTRNVISPPLGPAWERDVQAIFVAGYDAPDSYPTGAWLSRRFGGRLTTDRILFWGGMIPTFVVLMLRIVEVDGTWVQLLQVVAATLLLGVIAAQIDRRLAGEPLGIDDDLGPARDIITALDEAEHDSGEDGPGIGIVLAGAESADAVGAEAFFGDPRLKVKPGITVIGLVRGAPDSKPQVTGREGDLSTIATDASLAADSPLRPQRVIIRRTTAAGRARRRGARATTVVARHDLAVDLILDAFEGSLADGADDETSKRKEQRSKR